MDNKNTREREELHKKIWSIADDLRGSVDGWDFKQYILGMMFYRYISENITNYINEGERKAGDKDFDYAKLPDEIAETQREELVKEKGFFILPSELFCNVCKKAKNDENLKIITGKNYLDNLEKYDLIIKSPGVKFKDLDISKFEDKITSQLGLTLDFYKQNVIGITGTKGKSTTTSLIFKVLKDQGYDAYLLGNIGIPIFDYIEKFNENSKLVIEMAALQLEYVKTSPHIGIILNLFEEHLDFFKSKEHYFLAKLNMFKYQDNSDYGLYTSSNETLDKYVQNGNYITNLIDINKEFKIENNYVFYDNKKIYDSNSERLLLGKHNLTNIMFVLRLSELLKLDLQKTINTINQFKPLEHRMEYVATINGVKYYNDAIATIPEATIN